MDKLMNWINGYKHNDKQPEKIIVIENRMHMTKQNKSK